VASRPTTDLLAGRARLHEISRSTLDAARWLIPDYHVGPFHRQLSAVCDAVVDAVIVGSGARETASAPPRHGKSEMLGIATPTSLLARSVIARKPRSVLYVTANAERARKVSRKMRGVVKRLHALTSDASLAPGELWTQSEWETAGGFTWTSLGAGAATGGIGADLLLLDDLIGHGATYRSRAKREAIKEAVDEDYLSRLMGGSAIHIETRRGIEDTTGWLLREYGHVWRSHVWRCFERGRGYLWPELYGEEWRARMPHLTDSAPVWRALYQQEPVPEGGTLIPEEWLSSTYSESPTIAASLAERVVIGVDLAAKGKTTSDACAFVVIGVRGAFRDVIHVRSERMDYPAARQYLRELVAEWRPAAVVVEGAANGDALVADLQSVIPGLRSEPPRGDKVARLTPHLPAIAARQIRLPAALAPWTRSYREELTGFAGIDGEPDDQVDATVWALVAAAETPRIDWTRVLG